MPRPVVVVFALSVGSFLQVACGAPKSTDFLTAEGDSTSKGGSGSSQGGSATGGSGGSPGGSPATGGSTTGGVPTGGVAGMSTGGESTGGTSGSGGTASGGTEPGGAGGSGGSDGGGVSGSAGSGGGMSECDVAVMQAEAALREARACNPNSGGMLCTGAVQDLCGCTVPVEKQESQETKAYLALREAALRCDVVCPTIPCAAPTPRTVCFLGDSASCMYVR